MPQVVEPSGRTYEPTPNRKQWTRRECSYLQDSGLLTGRYELVEGEIISKMGQKPPHRNVVVLIHTWLVGVFGALFVPMQMPIDVEEIDNDTNEPEPDVAVVAQSLLSYSGNPGPGDLMLVVEVSDTTLRYDLTTKAAIYARAGIREYWVADVNGRQVYVHRLPAPEGYTQIVVFQANEMVATLTRPDAPVRVADLFPPVR